MTWHVLHAGKFVDADGVVVDRAEHEFLARSPDMPESVVRLIARQDPAPRLPPVEWLIGGHLIQAAFTQMMVRVDGQEFCLRVIDHQAFEGALDQPGRGYRKRTYLVKPADDWDPQDAALPLDIMVMQPHFQSFTECPPWNAPPDAPVDPVHLEQDLEELMASGRLALEPFMDGDATDRIAAVLAAMPPLVAARLDVRIGENGVGVIQAPGAKAQARPTEAGCGKAMLHILRQRGGLRGGRATVHSLAQAAAQPWRFAEPQWNLVRPFSEVRADLAWVVRCEAWLIDVDKALARDAAPPAPTLPASERLLKAGLDLFVQRDAIARMGLFAGPEWETAWRRIEVPAWRPVIDLLAGRSVADGDFTVLSVLPLADGVADRATAAWDAALDESSHEALVALFKSNQPWCEAFVASKRPTIVGLALRRICERPNAAAAWDAHPIRAVPEGRAIQALLAGAPIGEKRRAAIQAVGDPVADIVALLGDVEANTRCYHAIGHTGHGPVPDLALQAVLDWLGGRAVQPEPRMAALWAQFDAEVDIAASLDQGVTPAVLEECLAIAPERVLARDQRAAVKALLAQGDRIDRKTWLKHHRGGPWNLLAFDCADPGAHANLLDELQGPDVIGALSVYTGSVRPAWTQIDAADAAVWLRQNRPVAPLGPLAAAGASDAVAAALTAFLTPDAARKPHPGQVSAEREGRRILDSILADKNLIARTRIKRQAKRLLETP